ncbi:MAG: PaaI family thioesterase [Actinomycetota bacterium]
MADTAERTWIDPAIWLEPARGAYPDPRLFGLPGLEQLRSYFKGLGVPPPISYLTGLILTEVAPGTATFTMPASPWHLSPPGYVQLGLLAMLADSSLGCAIQTSLLPATPYTTSDLSLSLVRPVVADGGELVSIGKVIHSGRSLALSEVEIRDPNDRLVAHGTSRCFVLPQLDPIPDPSEVQPVELPAYDTPDPYLRPVAGSPVPQAAWDRMTGLEVMQKLIARELPAPPISHLTGLRPTEVSEGSATFALPTSPWLTSPLGTVQGGATALLADTVLATAVQTTLPARTVYAPLDLKVNYLRPVFADGRDLIGTAKIVHRGRTLAVASAEIFNADGKKVAVGAGTALIREGHPWRPDETDPKEQDSD